MAHCYHIRLTHLTCDLVTLVAIQLRLTVGALFESGASQCLNKALYRRLAYLTILTENRKVKLKKIVEVGKIMECDILYIATMAIVYTYIYIYTYIET